MPEVPTVGPGALVAVLALVLLIPAAAFVMLSPSLDSSATVDGDPTIVAEPYDADADGQAGWIRLVLLEDLDRTYEPTSLHVELVPPEGDSIVEHDDPLPYVRDKIVCMEPSAQRGVRDATRACWTMSGGTGGVSWFDEGQAWETGDELFVPCQLAGGVGLAEGTGALGDGPRVGEGSGAHRVRVAIHNELLMDQRVICDEAAPLAGS